jgi:hypothetical protein
VPADDGDGSPAALLALFVARFVALAQGLEDRLAVELFLVRVLDVADVLEFENDEPVELVVGQETKLAAARRVVHHFEHLARAGRAGESCSLGHLDLGLIADLRRAWAHGPRQAAQELGGLALLCGALVSRCAWRFFFRDGRLGHGFLRARGRRVAGGKQEQSPEEGNTKLGGHRDLSLEVSAES